jgi:biopolymer transport protein ExbD
MISSTKARSSSDAGAPAVNPDKVQAIAIHADGRLTLNGDDVALGEIQGRLQQLREQDPDLAVLIRSHHEQSVQHFSEVLDATRRAGVKRVGFASTPSE